MPLPPRAPPEILLTVVDHLDQPDVIRLAHVSRTWRAAALAHKTFYACWKAVLPAPGFLDAAYRYTTRNTRTAQVTSGVFDRQVQRQSRQNVAYAVYTIQLRHCDSKAPTHTWKAHQHNGRRNRASESKIRRVRTRSEAPRRASRIFKSSRFARRGKRRVARRLAPAAYHRRRGVGSGRVYVPALTTVEDEGARAGFELVVVLVFYDAHDPAVGAERLYTSVIL
ncbi:hypothetical protein EXIGLDRAFT_218638 [Exidia glandulosa HHB12029]|uniref:F-box domain-containing protein n=1 Tax=Exidia glandulosa HHB12029 TaxID=1314781 RepID=A0A165EE44_EXIGL|nr:hypothetical protein EXIGLDRAFT_218638 [Exidia glandulosa HHB12029]